MKNNNSLRIALEEVRYNLEKQLVGVDTIRDLAKTIIGAAAMVVTVIGALQTLRGHPPAQPFLYNGILIFSMLLFTVIIGLCLWVLMPVSLQLPFKADWNNYGETLLVKEEEDALLTCISQHLSVIAKNENEVEKVVQKVKIAGIGFIVVTISMMVLAMI